MKKSLVIILIAPIIILILISGTLYNEGSPGAKTGSPLDGASCVQCHSSSIEEVSWISSNIPVEGFKPGDTYTLTLNANPVSASAIGFEITAESELNKVGTFILTDTERTRFTNQNKAVTHSHLGTSPTNGKSVWQVNWKAPDNLDYVSFYAAFNAANGDASTSGDKIYLNKMTYSSAQTTAVDAKNRTEVKVYPNPAVDYLFFQTESTIFNVHFFTVNGHIVKTTETAPVNNIRLDISDLAIGFYIVKIQTTTGEVIKKIEIQ